MPQPQLKICNDPVVQQLRMQLQRHLEAKHKSKVALSIRADLRGPNIIIYKPTYHSLLVQKLISDYWGKPWEEFMKKGRKQSVVLTRYCYYYFMTNEVPKPLSCTHLAADCGVDHTTVLHGIESFENDLLNIFPGAVTIYNYIKTHL